MASFNTINIFYCGQNLIFILAHIDNIAVTALTADGDESTRSKWANKILESLQVCVLKNFLVQADIFSMGFLHAKEMSNISRVSRESKYVLRK